MISDNPQLDRRSAPASFRHHDISEVSRLNRSVRNIEVNLNINDDNIDSSNKSSKLKMPAVETSDSLVFIRSKEHGWIPASLVDSDGEVASVVVKDYDKEQDILLGAPTKTKRVESVKLAQYENHVLPLQNVKPNGDFDEYDDMVNLPHLHEAAILYNLKYRHDKHKPYTRTGDIIIAMNPYQWYNQLYTEKNRNHYAQTLLWENNNKVPTLTPNGGGSSDPRELVDPHIYEVSTLSYKGMVYDRENQSILVSGESGAGKTESVKLLMNHIADVQRGPASGQDEESQKNIIIQRILDSNPLLEAFGNAKTRRNDNSSRFGKYIELQFEKNNTSYKNDGSPATLKGSKCEVYLLEKNRVVTHDQEERNFHIFYQILAAPEEDKSAIWAQGLSGKSNESFRYVGHTATDTIEGTRDRDRFLQTKDTLDLIGIKDGLFRTLMQSICIVLQLGNIIFQQDAEDIDKSFIDPASIEETVGILVELMGLRDVGELTNALTIRTMTTRNETYKVPLNKETARDSCNAFAKEIYGRVFLWLVKKINAATTVNKTLEEMEQMSTIGLLDIFGFESFPTNRFEQLCINYANEKLQQKFTQDVFESVKQEYRDEGIPLEEIRYEDNADVLDLIESRKGLLAMLNEECVRPKGSSESYVFKLMKANSKKYSPGVLVANKMNRVSFGIRHFAGLVMYDANDFVTYNQDILPTDLLECGSLCSNNSIIMETFQGRQNHSAPTVKPGSKKQEDRDPSQPVRRAASNIMAPTVWTKYKNQLSTLMVNLRQTKTRYIRCIKPNTMKKPLVTEHLITVEQLRSAGIVAAVTISRAAFPNRLQNDIVYRRFYRMWDQETYPASSAPEGSKEQLREDCMAILSGALKPKEEVITNGDNSEEVIKQAFVVGKTRTYFRLGALEYLEAKRLNGLVAYAVTIQRYVRGWLIQKSGIRNDIREKRLERQRREKEEKERQERLAREEKERQERLAREAEELERDRLRKIQEEEERQERIKQEIEDGKREIEELTAKLKALEEEKEAKLNEASMRLARAKMQFEQCHKKAEMEGKKYATKKEKMEEKIAAYRGVIAHNGEVIKAWKEENKEMQRKSFRMTKQKSKLSMNGEKLLKNQSKSSRQFDMIKEEATDVFEKNTELLEEQTTLRETHKLLSADVQERQEEYLKLASDRLEIQNCLHTILNLIYAHCTNEALVSDMHNLIHPVEVEASQRLATLEVEFDDDTRMSIIEGPKPEPIE